LIIQLAYSFHLGSDKNKKNSSKASAKSNVSGTTSKSNNAIQNAAGLTKCDNHNYRKYDDREYDIEIIRGSSSLVNDVKKLYKDEFDEAKEEYNAKQTRENRKIKDYFTHISNNSKSDLACEIIIELGDKKYWDTKDKDFKKKMTNVFKQQVIDLETILPTFKIASAIIHYDETSPHLHIVGVPIKVGGKNGMKKQVGKSDVFTKESLRKLQDKMRVLCIESFNKEYGLINSLKGKKKGRNRDYHITEMDNYMEMKEQLEKNQESLEIANRKALELDNHTKEVKKIINDLKTTLTSKEKYVLKQEDKDKLVSYVDSVSKTNEEYKNIQTLSVTLNNVDTEIKENHEKIKTLTENNEALTLRVENLTKTISNKDKKIEELKEENHLLKNKLEFWKDKFLRVMSLIKDKLFGKEKEREKYFDVSKDLYKKGIIKEDTFNELKDKYNLIKEHDDKEKDDFEIEL
jgi:hypothetical protein